MSVQFAGKVSLVTGGSAGIGRAASCKFASEGAKVVVADINIEAGEETVRKINESGGQAVFIKTNVASADEVNRLVKKTVEVYGRLDYAFNNAGIEGNMGSTAECTEDNWDRTIAVNLKGVWLCMKYEIIQMLRQGGGAIVNMASIAGIVGFQGLPAYCASKGGVVQLTRAAALEYAGKGIRVNVICPGVIHTRMIDRIFTQQPEMEESMKAATPMGRLGKPEEIAAAVVWLCSDSASFVTGHPLVADGGWVIQ